MVLLRITGKLVVNRDYLVCAEVKEDNTKGFFLEIQLKDRMLVIYEQDNKREFKVALTNLQLVSKFDGITIDLSEPGV